MKVKIVHIIFACWIIWYGCKFPAGNGDIIGYVGICCKDKSPEVWHDKVYTSLKKSLPNNLFMNLVYGSSTRKAMYDNKKNFSVPIGHEDRVIYLLTMKALSFCGLDISKASWYISAFCTAIGYLIVSWSMPIYTPAIAMSLGILEVARLSTPDAIGFLFMILCVMKYGWILYPIMPLIRPDMILYVLLLSFYKFMEGKDWKEFVGCSISIVSFVILSSTLTVYSVEQSFAVVVHGDWNAKINYFPDLIGRIPLLLIHTSFFAWMVFFNKKPITLIMISYVFIHLLVYPMPWCRFFLAPYMLTVRDKLDG